MNVSVIGLGKLGLPLATLIAQTGNKDGEPINKVIGCDVNMDTVRQVNDGFMSRAAEEGRGVGDWLAKVVDLGWLTATCSVEEAVCKSEITMIVVPTPTDESTGGFDPSLVRDAVRLVGSALRDHPDKGWHTVVVCSTLTPGTMRNVIRPALERTSGRFIGRDVGLAYNPLFIALGSIIHDLWNADLVLIGAGDARTADDVMRLSARYQPEAKNHAVMPWDDAELTKLAINSYLSVKIGFANSIGYLAERIGADPRLVLNAVGQDSRVGRKFLRPGGPPTGPCLPRDLVAMQALASTNNVEVPLIDATCYEARLTVDRIIAEVLREAEGVVAILGLAYKPNSSVSDESLGLRLARRLSMVLPLRVHDPVIRVDDEVFPQVASVAEAIADADVVLIACPHYEYDGIDFGDRKVIRP